MSVAREVSLTPDKLVKMTEVVSAMTKSQTEAQEMSDSVTNVAEEIKQLRVSRAMKETVRAKVPCVGGAPKKPERVEIKSLPERIKYQGENMSERWDSLKTSVERQLQRQDQS